MPIIEVHMFEGRTVDQKRKLVAEMTDAVVKSHRCKAGGCENYSSGYGQI